MNYWLLLIPLLSALAGWFTIRLATWFLFNPSTPIRFFGFRLQGIFPRRQAVIAAKAADWVAMELSTSNMEEKVMDPGNFARIKPLVEAHMDDFLRNRLKDEMPMIGMFIGDKTIDSLKQIFIKEIETLFPRVMSEYSSGLDIRKMVEQKILAIHPNKMKTSVYSRLRKEFRLASAFGALIGFVAGILELILVICLN
jgi:uncharacterized membrane protein YheB (UPF0754 family)